MKTLHVNLPDHPYDIIVERASLSKSGEWALQTLATRKVVIITSLYVGKLYAETVKLSFEAAGFEVAVFAFLEDEASKNLTTVDRALSVFGGFWYDFALMVLWHLVVVLSEIWRDLWRLFFPWHSFLTIQPV